MLVPVEEVWEEGREGGWEGRREEGGRKVGGREGRRRGKGRGEGGEGSSTSLVQAVRQLSAQLSNTSCYTQQTMTLVCVLQGDCIAPSRDNWRHVLAQLCKPQKPYNCSLHIPSGPCARHCPLIWGGSWMILPKAYVGLWRGVAIHPPTTGSFAELNSIQ